MNVGNQNIQVHIILPNIILSNYRDFNNYLGIDNVPQIRDQSVICTFWIP